MLRKSPAELTNAELLSTLIEELGPDRCQQLLGQFTNFRQLARLNPAVLVNEGLPTEAVSRLEAVFEVARRYGETEWMPGVQFRSAADVYEHFKERLAVEQVELFYAVLLDNKHRKIRDVLISKGILNSSLVHPRDVYAQVVRYSAAGVIFVHNHPTGDPTPSKEDLEVTRRLREIGYILGVKVIDHVIVGQGRFVSFVDDGFW